MKLPPSSSRIDATRQRMYVIAIGVLSLVSIGLLVWGLDQKNDADEARADVTSVSRERDSLRQNATATFYRLVPTADAPTNATASAFFTIEGSGVLTAANLPKLGTNQSYQIWYQRPNGESAIPGGTFALDSGGNGFLLLPADVGSFTGLAITVEPATGSTVPTTPILLQVDVSGVRG